MKKFLSIILVLTLSFSVVCVSASAMETSNQQNIVENSYKVRLPFVFLFTGLAAVFSGLLGYKIGNNRRVNDEKEITLTGSILGEDNNKCMLIGTRTYDPRILINSCVDEIFQVDIPKLSKEGAFSASTLAHLAYQLRVYSHGFEDENLPYEYKQMSYKLYDMSMNIERYISESNQKIQAGYLKTLLRNAQKLAIRAGEIYDKIAQEKEQKKEL